MLNMVNAAPMVRDLGTQDNSTVRIPRTPQVAPQHLPKFYIFAQKGRESAELLAGVERENLYGSETFRMGSKFANHATLFSNAVNARANACIYQRLIPADAGPKANMTLWLDVLPTTVDLYERNIDGSIKTTVLGDPIITGTAAGYKLKWVTTSAVTEPEAAMFGTRTITPGDQVDVLTSVQSQRYPIFDFVVDSKGSYGSNLGIRMWAPLAALNEVPYKLMSESKSFPYFISVVERDKPTTSPSVKTTLFGEQKVMVTFKPGSIDPVTTKNLYVKDAFVPAYENVSDPRYNIEYAPFSGFHIYQSNLDTLLAQFHAAEVPFIDEFSDFGPGADQYALFNPITGESTMGVAYHSCIFVKDATSITFSQYTDVMASGGSDGTMTDEIFADMVSVEIKRYRDRRDEVMDLAYNIEQVFYDSGFPVATKLDLASFISQRHDTFLILGTHTWGERALTPSEEYALAISLRTRVQNYPESIEFGTPATRALIMGCSGVIRGSTYRVPATYEIAIKFAKYMGAGNGQWKNDYKPDGEPGSIVEELTDLNMFWVPETVRNRFWDAGLNWIGRFDREAYFIPAYKTVYTDDTSVLTSAITVMGICTLNKIGHACWRAFSGVSHLSNMQLCERVNNYVRNACKNKFDDRFIIIPSAVVTDMDEARGFSWTLPIKIGAEGAKTVQTLYVQANRSSVLRTD